MLPLHAHAVEGASGFNPEYLQRAMRFNLMDFEVALSQMVQLCFAPQSVFRASKHRKLTKNHWSRDDPAFVVLQVFFLVCAAAAYVVAFAPTVGQGVRCVLWEVVVHYLLTGMCVATATWYFSNQRLLTRGLSHSTRQEVEWLHAFDIHCNAFFPLFLTLYVVQYMLLPVLLAGSVFSRLLANGLYAAAFAHYFYVTFVGFLELPILRGQECFLYPIAAVAGLFILCTVLPFNATAWVLGTYFPLHTLPPPA
jgi:hypothetical protein